MLSGWEEICVYTTIQRSNPLFRMANLWPFTSLIPLFQVFLFLFLFSLFLRLKRPFVLEMFAQSHHPLGFLLECLEDVNHSLMNVGGRLHVFRGCSLTILRFIHSQYKINSLNFVDDSEAIWHNRNMAIEGKWHLKLNFMWFYIKIVCSSRIGARLPLYIARLPHFVESIRNYSSKWWIPSCNIPIIFRKF